MYHATSHAFIPNAGNSRLVPGWVPGAPQGEQPGHHADVPSLPPRAILHASANSAKHDAITVDWQFHSGLSGHTDGARPCDVASFSSVDDDASRPFKIQKMALAATSDLQPFADALPDSAGLSMPLPSPSTPSPACLMLDSHLAPTVDSPSLEVCMQFRSDSN